MKNIALIMMLFIPVKAAYAWDKDHIRNDERYDYHFDLIWQKDFNYYADNPIIKEGDTITLGYLQALKYCKGMILEELENTRRCFYNGRPIKRTIGHSRKKGYNIEKESTE